MSFLQYLSNFIFVTLNFSIAAVLFFCVFVDSVHAAPVFEEPINYVIGDLGDGEHGGNISDAVVVDLNNDGHLDIVGVIPEAGYDPNEIPNPDQGIVTLLNDGDGGYQIFNYTVFGDMPTSISSGDFDNDGDVDLAVNSMTDEIVILSNDGTGQFIVSQRYASGIVSEKLVSADFNNDGNLDLAISVYDATNSGQPEGNTAVLIFLNSGNGTFSVESTIFMSTPGFTRIADFTVADFNNDGHLDIVAGSGNGVLIYTVALNDGTGSFETSVVTLSIPDSEFVEFSAIDIDGDGDKDIITTTNNGLSRLMNNGLGTFAFEQDILSGYYENLTATDFDKDGDEDILATYSGINEVYIITNDGSGGFVVETVATLSFGSFTSAHAQDLNQDGKNDIVISSAQQLGIWVILQETPENLTPAEQILVLVSLVTSIDLPNNVENSYLANLVKVTLFIGGGQINPARNQLNAFINKVNQDYNQGKITQTVRDDFVFLAQQLIDDLED